MPNKYDLKYPFFALAPMAGITNYPFASQCYDFGADILWTPMIHTDVILNNLDEALKIIDFSSFYNWAPNSTPVNYKKKLKEIKYIVQVVGSDPSDFKKAINVLEVKINPNGYDINMGCPDKNIVKSGCGGSLMNSPKLALEIIRSTKSVTKKPVSVKTRAGFDNYDDIFELVPNLINTGVDAITIHPRTVKQGYGGEANWEIIKNLKLKIKNEKCILIGSGDIKTWQEALQKIDESGVDGLMIGRGALGRPWIFKEIKEKRDYKPDIEEIKSLVFDLSKKANEIWRKKGIIESRKHYGWYFRGFPGAKEARSALMKATNLKEVEFSIDLIGK